MAIMRPDIHDPDDSNLDGRAGFNKLVRGIASRIMGYFVWDPTRVGTGASFDKPSVVGSTALTLMTIFLFSATWNLDAAGGQMRRQLELPNHATTVPGSRQWLARSKTKYNHTILMPQIQIRDGREVVLVAGVVRVVAPRRRRAARE